MLGLQVAEVDLPAAVAQLADAIATRHLLYVCVANVHSVMEAHRDPAIRRVFNGGLTVPDGMPLVWMGRLRGRRAVGRVYGPDLTLALCEQAAARGWRCYFYGGGAGVAQALAQRLGERFPGLTVVGAESPPFRPLTPFEDDAVVARMNASLSDVVFVGLGCPKQEIWVAEHRPRLGAPLVLGVGAAFDFHTGRVAQAPRWMMDRGLEWLFRLVQEPRRLWRRYLILNPLFLFHATLQLLGRRYPAADPAAHEADPGPAAGEG